MHKQQYANIIPCMLIFHEILFIIHSMLVYMLYANLYAFLDDIVQLDMSCKILCYI